MKKEKFHIEYIFDKVSRRSLWNHLTTPPGLSAWFADDVIINGSIYVFKWNKAEQEAEVLSIKPEMSIPLPLDWMKRMKMPISNSRSTAMN